jgi:predicted nicotinamide N-methyase
LPRIQAPSPLQHGNGRSCIETFLLFSQDIPSQNLGIIDSHTPLLELTIGSRDLEIKQSPAVLNSARGGGTTGAVVWKVTPRFAEWLSSPGNILAQHGIVAAESSVLELGSGIAGIVPLTLAPLVQQYIATDQAYALKLLKENIDSNTISTRQTGSKNKKPSRKTNPMPGSNIQVLPLDWETDQVDSFLKGNNAAEGVDLVIACDCIYNYALIKPFVQTCVDICRARTSGRPTVCVIAQQLRQPDVFEEWLEEFHKHFRTWRLSDEVLTSDLKENSGFMVHVGILRDEAMAV